MKTQRLDIDKIPTQILEADLAKREDGRTVAERFDTVTSFLQKSAIVCLAGMLPLGAAREYSPSFAKKTRDDGFEDDRRGTGGIPDGRTMDLSTLQDLVSGVGVILSADFSLPAPTGKAAGWLRGGRTEIDH